MESETIQKNGASPKSQTSRGNFKKIGTGLKHFLAFLIVIAALSVNLSSCKKDPRDWWIEGLWETHGFHGFESVKLEIEADFARADFIRDSKIPNLNMPEWFEIGRAHV